MSIQPATRLPRIAPISVAPAVLDVAKVREDFPILRQKVNGAAKSTAQNPLRS